MRLWCASMISMSVLSPTMLAASSASLKHRLTPTLMLGANTIAISSLAALCNACCCSADRPVVPITTLLLPVAAGFQVLKHGIGPGEVYEHVKVVNDGLDIVGYADAQAADSGLFARVRGRAPGSRFVLLLRRPIMPSVSPMTSRMVFSHSSRGAAYCCFNHE